MEKLETGEVENKIEVSRFQGIVSKVQTIATGGSRVSFDVLPKFVADSAILMPLADTPGALVEVVTYRLVESSKKEEVIDVL